MSRSSPWLALTEDWHIDSSSVVDRHEYNISMPLVKIAVTLKPTLLDAQGRVVQNALHQLGYSEVEKVRIGRYIEVNVDAGANLDARVKEMCETLLSNPVIEDYSFEVAE